ncbi:MAG: HDOD domain-containing protein [Puniceicoccaceae bacterium]|nr:MAG: HDOD domain-containing protein [Puniceicoccaceae bacterium]
MIDTADDAGGIAIQRNVHIAFVDDEVMVINGLRRVMRDLPEDWSADYFESAGELLERMQTEDYDVVVADMDMPVMNGAELLNKIMLTRPSCVRFILSGKADKDLITRCVGSSHQYLSKPCDPEVLMERILSSLRLQAMLKANPASKVVSDSAGLKSFPRLYQELMLALENPDCPLEDIGKIIEQDMGLTTRILMVANSGYFGLRRKVVSPAEAIQFIGLETVKALALAVETYGTAACGRDVSEPLENLWNRSISMATLARNLAQLLGMEREESEVAFSGGLLADAGKLLFLAKHVDLFLQSSALVQGNLEEELELETAGCGANHTEIGGYLFQMWGFPQPIVECVALHHHPSKTGSALFGPLLPVHLAATWSRCQHTVTKPQELYLQLDQEYCDRLKFGLAGMNNLWNQLSEYNHES